LAPAVSFQSGRWKDLVTEYYHVQKVRHLPMETFLQRIFEIEQCQLMVINNDNSSNGRNKIYQTCRPNIPIKLLTHPKIPHPSLPLKKKIILKSEFPDGTLIDTLILIVLLINEQEYV
jgi:hypothetical protein